MQATYPLADFDPPAVCMDCKRELAEGAPYSERLVSVAGDSPVVEIVCPSCALSDGNCEREERL